MASDIFDEEKQSVGGIGALPIIIVGVSILLLLGLVVVLSLVSGMPAASYNYEAARNVSSGGPVKEMVHDFTWVLYPVFLFSIYFFYKLSTKLVLRRKNELGLMFSLMGAVLLLVAVLSLFGMSTAVQHLWDANFPTNLLIGWLVEFSVFAIAGLGLSFAGNKLNDGKTPLIGTLGFLVLPTLILSAFLLLAVGANDAIIYEPSETRIPLDTIELFGWLSTVVVFFVLSALSTKILKNTARVKSLASSILPLKLVSGLYLFAALIAFIWGMLIVVNENFAFRPIFVWLAQSLFFGVVGTGAFLLAMKLKSKLPKVIKPRQKAA